MRTRRPKALRAIFAWSSVIFVSTGLLFAPQAKALPTFREIPQLYGDIHMQEMRLKIFKVRDQLVRTLKDRRFSTLLIRIFLSGPRKMYKQRLMFGLPTFPSKVTINVDARWTRSSFGILGVQALPISSTDFLALRIPRSGIPSALANALAGTDLDPKNPEILIQANSNTNWINETMASQLQVNTTWNQFSFTKLAMDLDFFRLTTMTLFHEVESWINQRFSMPTCRTPDGHRVSDILSPSIELGNALTHTLVWSGPLGYAANDGVKPLLYTPARYEAGSSVSHLDEATFSSSGLNNVMTPNLDAGEVFHQPGPLLVAMLNVLRNKPPVVLLLRYLNRRSMS
ncbi:MAG: hypothetical protein WDO06_08765 [Actinomycetota bacterium]